MSFTGASAARTLRLTGAMAGLTLSSLAAAAVTSAVAGALLEPDVGAEPVLVQPRLVDADSPEPVPARNEYVQRIVGGNLFDASAIGASPEAESEPEATLQWQLLGTLVAEPARFSTAMVALGEDFEIQEFVGVGDVVGQVTVLAIEERSLLAELADGREVRVELRTEPIKKRRARRGSRTGPAIEKVGRNHVAVRESLVKRYANNPARLARLGNARPMKRNGEVIGYRLTRIRRNSHGHKIGLRNGDVVRSVNGHKLTSMKSAMQAYGALQNEDRFEIEVERRRKSRTLKVDLK